MQAFRCVFNAFYSDQAFCDFLDTCSMYFFHCLYKKVSSFYICIEKEYDKIYDLVFAVDSIINFYLDHPVCIIVMKLRKINKFLFIPQTRHFHLQLYNIQSLIKFLPNYFTPGKIINYKPFNNIYVIK